MAEKKTKCKRDRMDTQTCAQERKYVYRNRKIQMSEKGRRQNKKTIRWFKYPK